MNSNGDYAGKFIGVGSESSPSLAVGSEPSTGIYLETPGAASGLNFTKRGTKRLRIDDSGSTFYGPVNCGTGSSFSTITLSDGSQALPSLNFAGATTSGLSLDTSGTSTHLHTSISGVSKIRVQDDFINTNVPFHLPTGSTTQPALTFSSSSSCGLSFDTQGTSSHVHTSVAGISRTRVSEDLFYLTVPIEAGTNAISGGPLDCTSLDTKTISHASYIDFNVGAERVLELDTKGNLGSVFSGPVTTGGPVYTEGTENVAAPDYSWDVDETSGFLYKLNGGTHPEIITSISGSSISSVSSTGINVSVPVTSSSGTSSFYNIRSGGGSTPTPGFSFTNGTNSGLEFTNSPSTLIPVLDGVSVASFRGSLFTSFTPVTCGTQSLTCGSLSCSSISISGQTGLSNSLFFGNGSDGSVTLTGGTTTLTKDMYYTTLTLNSSAIIKTNGCRIFASVAINGDGTGIIHFNGNDASGQTAGSAVVFGSPMPGNSSAGGSGGAINTNGSISTNTAGCAGGRGGHGGDSDTKTGASSGTIPFSITYVYQNPLLANTYFNGPGGSGGGGGAGQSTTNVGGGGGASGGIVWIAAKSFGGILALQANGGNGGNSTGSAGVGAGGGGGFVYLLYETLTGGWNPATQISVAGGTNGTGGNTTNSTNSSVGNYVCYQLT